MTLNGLRRPELYFGQVRHGLFGQCSRFSGALAMDLTLSRGPDMANKVPSTRAEPRHRR